MENNISLEDICNNNVKNMPSKNEYIDFNKFIFSNDIKLLGKMLKSFEFFLLTKDLPGDIIELGVYKGSGISKFSKFLEIYQPNSIKKVIGFDLFDANNNIIANYNNGKAMTPVYNKVPKEDLTYDNVLNNLKNINKDKFELIKGDICKTTKEYVEQNPGLRISLLYIDVDLDEPTYHGLNNLWNNIVPGGIILFDEYQYHKFDESNGVDKFLKENNIEYNIKTTNWIAPDCFMIKKT